MSNDIIKLDVSDLIEKETAEIQEGLETNKVFNEDFEKTRINMLNIIEKSTTALEDFSELAQQSGHPKSYEALAALIKTTIDANKALLDLHQTGKRYIGEPKEGSKGIVNKNTGNTNIIMVGSTKDILSMLKNEDV